MQLTEILDYTLGAIINTMCYVIIMKKAFGVKLNKNKTKIYLSLIFCSFILAIINLLNKDMFKPIFTIPIMALAIKEIMDQKFTKSFIMTISAMIYLIMSELVVAILVSVIKIPFLFEGIFGSTLGNILVAIFAIPFIYIKPLKKFLNGLIIWFTSKKKIGVFLIILFFAGALLSRNANYIKNISEIITNFILTISFIIIVILLINEYQKVSNISNEYNNLFYYLKEYEKELVEKRKIIHDYNNQLVIINGYVDNKNIKLKKYISLILKEQKEINDNKILSNTENLPIGLRGLFCYKIATMPKNIKLEINVDKKLKNIKIKEELLKDYSKISGVFLDNAIESASLSKEKNITITASIEQNEIIIEYKNTFNDKPDERKIYLSGYSTKGKDRGYGLSLVKDITNKNAKIKTTINIEKNIFIAVQTLKI